MWKEKVLENLLLLDRIIGTIFLSGTSTRIFSDWTICYFWRFVRVATLKIFYIFGLFRPFCFIFLFICFEFGFSQYYAQAPKVEPPPPEKAPKKNAAKPSEKKGKAVEAAKEAPLDPLEEKLRQQRWVSAILACTGCLPPQSPSKKQNKTKINNK